MRCTEFGAKQALESEYSTTGALYVAQLAPQPPNFGSEHIVHVVEHQHVTFSAPSGLLPSDMADLGLPISKNFDLVGPGKCVTALEADSNGGRLVAGGNDYFCHLYDFGGLKTDGKSFRSFEVTEGHPVVAVSGVQCVGAVAAAAPPAATATCRHCRLLPPASCCLRTSQLPEIVLAVFGGADDQLELLPLPLQVSWSPTGDAFMVVTSYAQVCVGGWAGSTGMRSCLAPPGGAAARSASLATASQFNNIQLMTQWFALAACCLLAPHCSPRCTAARARSWARCPRATCTSVTSKTQRVRPDSVGTEASGCGVRAVPLLPSLLTPNVVLTWAPPPPPH